MKSKTKMSDIESNGAAEEVAVEPEEEGVKDLKTAIKRVNICIFTIKFSFYLY